MIKKLLALFLIPLVLGAINAQKIAIANASDNTTEFYASVKQGFFEGLQDIAMARNIYKHDFTLRPGEKSHFEASRIHSIRAYDSASRKEIASMDIKDDEDHWYKFTKDYKFEAMAQNDYDNKNRPWFNK